MKTIEEAKQWAEDNREECSDAYENSKGIPDFLRSPQFEKIWISGYWLSAVLKEAGATKQQIDDIGFAHGQRCFYQDSWEVSVAYINEFETHKSVVDKPGYKLAMQLKVEFGTQYPLGRLNATPRF